MRRLRRTPPDKYRLGLADRTEFIAPMILGVLIVLCLLSLVLFHWGGAVS